MTKEVRLMFIKTLVLKLTTALMLLFGFVDSSYRKKTTKKKTTENVLNVDYQVACQIHFVT